MTAKESRIRTLNNIKEKNQNLNTFIELACEHGQTSIIMEINYSNEQYLISKGYELDCLAQVSRYEKLTKISW
jgi:hypothetical protein